MVIPLYLEEDSCLVLCPNRLSELGPIKYTLEGQYSCENSCRHASLIVSSTSLRTASVWGPSILFTRPGKQSASNRNGKQTKLQRSGSIIIGSLYVMQHWHWQHIQVSSIIYVRPWYGLYNSHNKNIASFTHRNTDLSQTYFLDLWYLSIWTWMF